MPTGRRRTRRSRRGSARGALARARKHMNARITKLSKARRKKLNEQLKKLRQLLKELLGGGEPIGGGDPEREAAKLMEEIKKKLGA